MNLQRLIATRRAALAVSLALLGACGPGSDVEIELVRRVPPEARFAQVDASSSQRFGGGQAEEHEHSDGAASRFAWEVPDDWVTLEPKQFRDINFRPGGQPELECYLTILQGDGGGLSANVNRWRGQLGLGTISEEEAAQLPMTTLFGRPAVRVELQSEGDDARALLGVIFTGGGSMATVKMIGPAALVEQYRAGFELFRETLAVRDDTPAPPVAMGAPTSSPSNSGSHSELTYDLPEGWSDEGAKSMRIVNLLSPGASQCYVIRLAGEAGGLLGNLNRWRSEVGLEAFDQAGIDALAKVTLLGQECGLLEVSGEYRGMGEGGGAGKTVLGIALIGSDSSLFVKMVGSAADVAAEKHNFMQFLSSLKDA